MSARSIWVGAGSGLWSSVTAIARSANRWGLTPSRRLPARVISVGNIQVGGTGKTPLVARIANEAIARGLSVCILTRGYRGGWESKGGLIRPHASVARALEAGDEACLLQWLVPGAWIAIGRNRGVQFDRAVAENGRPFDLVLLDDGFQHLALKRDLDIVLLTSFGPGVMFYRDWPASVPSSALLVWTKGSGEPRLNGRRPDVQIEFKTALLKGAPRGKPLLLVTGLADGLSARKTIEQMGARVCEHLERKDHTDYSSAELQKILARAQSIEAQVATTGKDWVKWRELPEGDKLDALVYEVAVDIKGGQDAWNRALWGS